MDLYSVLVVARGDGEVDEAALDLFLDAAKPWHASVTGGTGEYTARIFLEGGSPALAAEDASNRVRCLAAETGLPDWPHVKVDATREDVFTEEQERPQLPDLVSGPEAAEILGVSTQRLHQLAAEHPRFPQPIIRLRGASIWLRRAIERFDETWERKPGRPKKTA